ncbi:MAG TPA: hypothetical protein PLD14_02750 [Candidatus Pacearchaeota archaeon]|nr:hypothetical protein [Candidatus Pacearchaeota archaeon]HPR80120.1 hypothetical protein [Candidatus Pacearchaeota archaeon]
MEQSNARKIMGLNYFGIEEAIEHFGVIPTEEELANLANVPFSWASLRRLKKTHILVAVFPLSIIEIRARVRENLFFKCWDDYSGAFLEEKETARWRLVRKNQVTGSFMKSQSKQEKLLNEKEEMPTARVLVYTIIGQCLAHDEFLFDWGWARTSSVKNGYSVSIGDFHHLDGILYQFSGGLSFRLDDCDSGIGNLGISSAIKP